MNSIDRFSTKLLNSALDLYASDIHFSPTNKIVRIYFRIHGKRHFHHEISVPQYEHLLSYYKFSSGMDIGEKRKPQNGALTFYYHKRLISLRISTLPVHPSESLAIRLLPQDDNISFNRLCLFPYQLNKIKKWIRHRSGVILFTGPTGSGKTTTLYALLQSLLEEQSYQTITLEDPIEKEIKDLLQVQVNEKSGLSYQVGLKAALRHDPDIIMVGEIRDENTAKFVFHAAYTGHLVLSTLHAKNAFGTIYRLKEMGIPITDLDQSLIAVAAIELLPIILNEQDISRAAILELLDGDLLHEAINGQTSESNKLFYTFEKLRRKAYAYGFSKEK
ncbi:comG operon protein 1 [Paraliobacillus ryukyuensis]|uniref:Competence-related pilin export protein ComGA n=1 Tax=Paraliobacillus ryukyuensis TaxID=200904 RepID=A0A366EG50_9BACI|nr:competence type IV pilus ATPase ComGA [Paraliobacillus ryukyuensis]RBP01411.1 competence-related pilin export protein ComGA [Paraliobacillus ryukyuensis]